jgi:hypothetical protein
VTDQPIDEAGRRHRQRAEVLQFALAVMDESQRPSFTVSRRAAAENAMRLLEVTYPGVAELVAAAEAAGAAAALEEVLVEVEAPNRVKQIAEQQAINALSTPLIDAWRAAGEGGASVRKILEAYVRLSGIAGDTT